MRLIYTFVLDGHPRFLVEGEIFLRTLLGSGVACRDIVAQVTARSGTAGKALAARFGVRAIDLPLGPDKSYCNKIGQLFTLADADYDVLIVCDTDLAILSPLHDVARLDVVRARRVHGENPPLSVLESVRTFFRVAVQPPLVAPGCAPQALTYALNCNGGMLMIPRPFVKALGETWLELATALVGHMELMQRWPNHVDQVSWAFAMQRLQLPFEELPVEYNFPTVLAHHVPGNTYRMPIVLHHHHAIKRGRIRLTGMPLVDRAIRLANERLPRRMREKLLQSLGLH